MALVGVVGCGKSEAPVDLGKLSVLAQPWDPDADVPWQAAEIMGKLSKAAYLDEAAAETAFQEIGFDKVTPNEAGSMVSYIVVKGPVAVIVFRGTDDLGDWLANIKVLAKEVAGGNMHVGFHDAYDTLKGNIHSALAETKPKHLWITGHSLGGALAVVCAHDLNQNKIEVQGLVTFGQPMVADADLAAHLDECLANKYQRYINGADIVARIPPRFRHAGSFVWFRKDGVTHSPMNVETDCECLPERPPLGPPPLSADKFEELQQFLRQLKAKRPKWKEPPSLPFIDDHGMDRYLERINKRGDTSQVHPGMLPFKKKPLLPRPRFD